MIDLLANAMAAQDNEFMGKLVYCLIGLGFFGTNYISYRSGKKHVEVHPNPLRVELMSQYTLKEDFEKEMDRLETAIKDLAKLQRDGDTNAHKRMDRIEPQLAAACMGINMLLQKAHLPPVNPKLLPSSIDES